jgi:RES domain-containing protein
MALSSTPYHFLPEGTILYRVTRPDQKVWPADVVSGQGAFFASGRYNRPDQTTVYASAEPVVAVTEAAYYAARDRQGWIGT